MYLGCSTTRPGRQGFKKRDAKLLLRLRQVSPSDVKGELDGMAFLGYPLRRISAEKWTCIERSRRTHQFENNKEQVIDDERPLATVAISGNTKDDGPDGSQHEHKRDTPGDVGDVFPKRLSQIRCRQ